MQKKSLTQHETIDIFDQLPQVGSTRSKNGINLPEDETNVGLGPV